MPDEQPTLTFRKLNTPRAAALAGILFALLFGSTVVLIRLSIPTDPADNGAWLKERAGTVSLALSLLPFAGIAFLWFMGVVRDRIGHLEDQLFSTVFFGSGLLFLALTFVDAAFVGGALASYAVSPSRLMQSGTYTLVREVMFRIMNVYAVKMASVFMISLGTIWVRTQVMPRLLALLTCFLALGLLLSTGANRWVALIFPAWVGAVSVYILASNLRTPAVRS
ncbi:MAG: hypothetical protein U0587_19210 [Candidatus Binatia bacterium]